MARGSGYDDDEIRHYGPSPQQRVAARRRRHLSEGEAERRIEEIEFPGEPDPEDDNRAQDGYEAWLDRINGS